MIPCTRPFVLLASLVLVGLIPAGLRAEVEFTGLIALKDGALFTLVDRAAGTRSGWIGLRQEFAGYTLATYDAKTDVLALTKDGAKTELRLNVSKVQPARLELHGAVGTTAGATTEIQRATLVFDEDNSFPLKNGGVLHLTPHQRPDGTLQWQARFERPRADGSLETMGVISVITRPNQAASIQIGDRNNPADNLGFSFTPTVTETAAGPAGATDPATK